MSKFAYNSGKFFKKMLSCLCITNANFSFKHNMHYFVVVLGDWCIRRIFHDVWIFLFCFSSFQILLEISVSVLYFLFLKKIRWFPYRELNLVSIVDVIFVVYKTLLLRHSFFRGQLDSFIQSHVLCMLILDFIFRIQL